MRGLMNLALAINEAGRYDDALEVCSRFEAQTGHPWMVAGHAADVHLNTRAWGRAVEAAVACGDEGAPFVEAFASFELGSKQTALRQFLRGALLSPRAARMLVGLRSKGKPDNPDEAADHNAGIAMSRRMHAFLKKQSPASKTFFKRLMTDPRVERLLVKLEDARRLWLAKVSPDDHRGFEQMTLMRTKEFAFAEAGKLVDLVGGSSRDALLH
jgi:hypothetical protein